MRPTEHYISQLISKCTPEQLDKIHEIFWRTVDRTGYSHDQFRSFVPKWCKAIDELPNTDNLSMVNDICLEVTLDIVKEAMSS